MDSDLFAPKRKSVTCCVTPCITPQVPNCSFHSFPSEADIRHKWQQALSIESIDDGMKVCGGHFRSEDFFPTCAFKVRKLHVKRLKRTAVPSLFLPSALREEDALRIVKVESLSAPDIENIEGVSSAKKAKSDNSPSDGCEATPGNDIKTEPGTLGEKDLYSIETFCCTTCGLISNTEAVFLEHLGTHVKNENQNFLYETEEDPLGAGLPDDSDNVVIVDDEDDYDNDDDDEGTLSADETISVEDTLTAESTEGTVSADESRENDDNGDLDEFDGKNDVEVDEEFLKFLSSHSSSKFLESLVSEKLEHACFLCDVGSRYIKTHLFRCHALHPAVLDFSKGRSKLERRQRLTRLILVGDFSRRNRTDRVVRAFCKIQDPDSFENFMRRCLTLLDERLREFVFDIYCKRQLVKEGKTENFSPYTDQRLFQGDGPLLSNKDMTRKHKCAYCDFGTDIKMLAMAHFQLHSGGKNFGCHGCQRYFESFESLMLGHTGGFTCTAIRLLNFQLRCDFCWSFFTTRKEFEWHVMLGSCLYRSVACERCGEKMIRKHLPAHTRKVHPGDVAPS